MALLIVPALLAADWPQWLGRNRDGASPEKVAAWKEPLLVLWKKPVGEGHSSPVVAKGRVYLHTRVAGKDQEQLSAFDAATGDVVWQSVPIERGKFLDPFNFGTGPRATPTVAQGRVYTFGITGILSCVQADSGKPVWQIDTLKQYKTSNLFFGTSCSPLVENDLVLVNVGGKGASVVAFDTDSGQEKWKALNDPASYASPIGRGSCDDRHAIFLTGRRLIALSVESGHLLWEHPLVDKLSESSTTPVIADKDILFGSSITFGGVALKLGGDDKNPSVKQLWAEPKYNCYFSTPVAVGEQLYIVTGSKPLSKVTKATLRCVDAATGKELWIRDKVGTYHASLLRTGDGKLLMLEEPGDLVMLEPNPAEYREVARSKICGKTWAHPALADGRLYVRDGTELICVALPR
jgi:outer membrane protein assembly factor BamB